MQLTLFAIPGFLLLLLGTSIGCAPAVTKRSVDTTACRLAEQGASAEGQRVRISVTLTTDGQEYSVLTDERCPDVRLAPYWSESRDEKSAALLSRAVWSRLDDNSVRVVRYDVTGVYKARSDKFPQGALFIEKIWSLERVDIEASNDR